MLPDDLLYRSAVDLAAMVRAKDASAVELMDAFQARIDALDPTLHAFVQPFGPRARRAAARTDAALAKGQGGDRSLVGVPWGVKDTEAIRGSFFHAGARALKWVWSPVDAPAVKRMRAMGLTIAGRTTTSELALMPVVETELQPGTATPWDPAYSAGGSSGGSASAVAAGMLPIAAAADGAGSIRIPASCNHLFGFKPSFGATENYYKAFDPVGLAVLGSVTHHVIDSAVVLDGLAGRPNWPPQPGSFAAACDQAPPKGLRIGLCLESPMLDVQPDIIAKVRAFAETLESMGHTIVEMDGAHDGTLDHFIPIYGRVIATSPIPTPWLLQPVTKWIRGEGRKITVADAIQRAAALAEEVHQWWGDVDLAITPTMAVDPPKVGAWKHLDPEAEFRAAASMGAFTAPFNLTGQPAASIPVGLSNAGLPIGAQLVAKKGEDALLFSLCAELQRALQWDRRRAPMATRSQDVGA